MSSFSSNWFDIYVPHPRSSSIKKSKKKKEVLAQYLRIKENKKCENYEREQKWNLTVEFLKSFLKLQMVSCQILIDFL